MTPRLPSSSLFAVGLCLLAACQNNDTQPPISSSVAQAARTDASVDIAKLDYVTVLTGGANEDEALPLVLAMHGLGDTARNFSELFGQFEGRARVLAVQAPTAYGEGYSWFAFKWPDGSGPEGGTIEEAAASLHALAEKTASAHKTLGKPIVTGFSQGGILSFAMATLYPDAVGAALPIAGTMSHELRALATERAKQLPPIDAFHGAADYVVDVRRTRLAVKALARAGAQAELNEYEGVGHHVSPELKSDYFGALDARLKSARDSG